MHAFSCIFRKMHAFMQIRWKCAHFMQIRWKCMHFHWKCAHFQQNQDLNNLRFRRPINIGLSYIYIYERPKREKSKFPCLHKIIIVTRSIDLATTLHTVRVSFTHKSLKIFHVQSLFMQVHLYKLFHVLSLWGPSCNWSLPRETLTQESCRSNLHMRGSLNTISTMR